MTSSSPPEPLNRHWKGSALLRLAISRLILARQKNQASLLRQFLQSKSQFTRSAEFIVAVITFTKGGPYGIPSFSCCRVNDGALRANHSGLLKAARMVTNRSEKVINVNTCFSACRSRFDLAMGSDDESDD